MRHAFGSKLKDRTTQLVRPFDGESNSRVLHFVCVEFTLMKAKPLCRRACLFVFVVVIHHVSYMSIITISLCRVSSLYRLACHFMISALTPFVNMPATYRADPTDIICTMRLALRKGHHDPSLWRPAAPKLETAFVEVDSRRGTILRLQAHTGAKKLGIQQPVQLMWKGPYDASRPNHL